MEDFPKLERSILCMRLRTASLVTLGANVVLSLILSFGLPVWDYYAVSNVQVRFEGMAFNIASRNDYFGDFPALVLIHFIPGVLLELGPFISGFYGVFQKKATYLLLCILDAFILTGFILRHLAQYFASEVNGAKYLLPTFRLLLLWFSALVWYSYYVDIKIEKKSFQAAHVPLNSDEPNKEGQEAV